MGSPSSARVKLVNHGVLPCSQCRARAALPTLYGCFSLTSGCRSGPEGAALPRWHDRPL